MEKVNIPVNGAETAGRNHSLVKSGAIWRIASCHLGTNVVAVNTVAGEELVGTIALDEYFIFDCAGQGINDIVHTADSEWFCSPGFSVLMVMMVFFQKK